ncbi:MAG: 50S ribosomal protein L30 [Chloroflexi bacterium]|nr:50S ribosomal protein L30 [Chloroflexota bacterium]
MRITYRKSSIGYSERQKQTVRSLGLRKLGQSVERPDTTTVRGMVFHVRHLVTVQEVPGAVSAEGVAASV